MEATGRPIRGKKLPPRCSQRFMEISSPVLRFVSLPRAAIAAVRTRLTDARGYPVFVEPDRHGGRLCRCCLQATRPGELVILFAYCPFPHVNPYAETGPVLIHARDCTWVGDPPGLPPELRRRPVVLRAYSREQEPVGARLVTDGRIEDHADQLLGQPDAAWLHARTAEHGCYLLRIERLGAPLNYQT